MNQASQPVLEMHDADIVSLRDASLTVLRNVNWAVRPGEFWVVGGSPRSGKTDLLFHAAGLMAPVKGSCRVFGGDTRLFDETQIGERLRVGLVFSDGRLFNRLSIEENIALPLRYHRQQSDADLTQAVAELLALLELTPLAQLTPANIAPGWRQRVALARALVFRPDLLLLDNPLAGLGARHRVWFQHFLDELWQGHKYFGGKPVTLVLAAEDLSVWRDVRRKFALLHKEHMTLLGEWDDTGFSENPAVKDLLALPPVA